jgi:hypothetical protein
VVYFSNSVQVAHYLNTGVDFAFADEPIDPAHLVHFGIRESTNPDWLPLLQRFPKITSLSFPVRDTTVDTVLSILEKLEGKRRVIVKGPRTEGPQTLESRVTLNMSYT